ncbi:putative bifunctional diguanylate cyclase/phosphodiesterase [Sabulicella glaciei]|uniref:EAL domain-containing protein n=1 Tax=Sabulicella glaciei TaxID=2984948 RepID=A0ABT3P1D1_9PROT|nr:EAL domain-containing protein [Roseococcus sp. MDT2-1-1]MCW8088233.1 EAL domain-containing protein [Roseococcus sp. MDT2-1-1]
MIFSNINAVALKILDETADGVLVTDSLRVLDPIAYANAAFCRMTGYSLAETLGRNCRFLQGDDRDQPEIATMREAIRSGRSTVVTLRNYRRDGSMFWNEVRLAPLWENKDGVGRPRHFVGFQRDVTTRVMAEIELREAVASEKRSAEERASLAEEAERAAARLASVLESTMDCVVVLDHEWRVTYLNENTRRILGARDLPTGSNLWEVYPEEADGIFARRYRQALADQKPVSFEEHLSALDVWLEVQACPTPEGLSIFFRDITERRRAERERLLAHERMAHMARHDALTGLPNRTFFRERVEHVMSQRSEATRHALLCLDLDGFKGVNDTLGHPAGDALLRAAAERLQTCVRGSDLVARFAGDEFVILQTEIAGPADAEVLARRILDALSAPFVMDAKTVSIGTSIGIAVAPDHGRAADDLLRVADSALSRAKKEGRGTHRLFTPGMDTHLQERHVIRQALHGALERGELELHFQPLVALATGRLTAFEALLRWHHPRRGLISPAHFVPIAEETGVIVPIGEWALQEACRTAATWPDPISVAVNLSPAQFRSRTLLAAVRRALGASGLEAERLQLEITESVLLLEDSLNLRTLEELRRLGVRLAMDDFGTGYSSLSYLRSFPFDKIKLDQSFVRDLPNSADCQAIVRAVAGLASGLRIAAAAEGIETEEQFAALRAKGFDEGQGHLFGAAVRGSEVPLVIARYQLSRNPRIQGN